MHSEVTSLHSNHATPSIQAESHPQKVLNTRTELDVDALYPQMTSSPATTIFEDPLSNTGECCGGLFDCDGFCEDKDSQSNMRLSRMSGMRSTAE